MQNFDAMKLLEMRERDRVPRIARRRDLGRNGGMREREPVLIWVLLLFVYFLPNSFSSRQKSAEIGLKATSPPGADSPLPVLTTTPPTLSPHVVVRNQALSPPRGIQEVAVPADPQVAAAAAAAAVDEAPPEDVNKKIHFFI